VEALLQQNRSLGAEPPPELRYLLAKAAYQRTDLPRAERVAVASEAFAKVGKPFELQALYFQGVLRIEAGDLPGAITWFERCAGVEASGDRDREVRELCTLALGRVHSELGEPDRALSSYAAVPFSSPHFPEAAYETALAYVRAKRYDEALEMTSFVPDLDPESPLAPEALVVRGHLLLRLGRFAEATETYNVVINTYAPVRDEIDAILATGEDPMRYYGELAGRKGSAFEVASILPPIAVKWATQSREVASALDYVRSIESAREEVAQARDVAVRLESLLERGGGIDAFSSLQRAYAHAQAVENAAARAEGSYVAAAAEVALEALKGQRLGELERAREVRSRIERRFESLPRSPASVEERLGAMRALVDEVLEELHRLAIVRQSCLVDIDGIDAWLDKNRAEIRGDEPSRQGLAEELRRERAIVEQYDGEISEMRQQVALVRDSAGGVDSMVEESRLRADYLAAVERERRLAEEARGSLEGRNLEVFERMDRGRARLADIRTRARSLKLGVASEATRRAESFRKRIAAERLALAGHEGTLEGLLQASQEVLGPIALRSISEVRGLFYRIVLKADVGIVDVAWSRKRARLEKIQGLAVRKDEELEQLDRDFRALTREEE
jgi:tetratricopeptide (TPR) repeat protein